MIETRRRLESPFCFTNLATLSGAFPRTMIPGTVSPREILWKWTARKHLHIKN
jgi:hypothetical protein